jgi:hypothetical protein
MSRTRLDVGIGSLLKETSDLHDATLISIASDLDYIYIKIADPYMREAHQYSGSLVWISLMRADDCVIPDIPYLPQPIHQVWLAGNKCDQFELLTEDGWKLSLRVRPESSWVEVQRAVGWVKPTSFL